MKNACRNFVPLDKLRRRLTKKNITSLLILPAIAAAFFTTPTIAFAKSPVSDSGQLPTISVIPTIPSNRPSNPTVPPIAPLTSIRMLDKTHGWALTQSAILKTTDGGLHWQNVTPTNAKFNPMFMPEGDFLNAQNAWIATPQGEQKSISTLRTTDGGKSWQSSPIQTTITVSGGVMLHFLNASDGWLQAFGAGGRSLLIFQTTDGGQHWNQVTSPNLKDITDPNGISFNDAQTGWAAGENLADTINNTQPVLGITHDGGKTWSSQPLPMLPGGGKDDMVITRPPVFFGNNGLLPVDQIVPSPDSKSSPIGLNLYVTQNGGQTWTPTKLVTSNVPGNAPNFFTVDITDMQHVWAANGTNLYVTSNGGQSWIKLPPTPLPISDLSFVDANNGWAIVSTETIPGDINTQQTQLLHTTNGGHTWQPINYSIIGQSATTSTIGERVTVKTFGG